MKEITTSGLHSQNPRNSNEGTLRSSFTETTAAAATETNGQSPEGIISGRRIRLSSSHESMCRATVEGDLVAAEVLLQGDPNLASDEISEEGDRALHLAAAMKHEELVKILVRKMRSSDLELLDGHGYTACCYAAMAEDAVEIADLMISKNRALATARDRENKTPLYKAALRGNAEMVSYFLESVQVDDLSTEEWFELLLVSIRREMYGVALGIVRRNEQLATMRNDEGTALHKLAGQHFNIDQTQWMMGEMRKDMGALAKVLWEGVKSLGQSRALELMKNPPILNAAAKHGNMELLTMITHTYPHLAWHADSNGYTMFHTAVMHRQETIFQLIDEIGVRKDLIAVAQDENGNNILHLAAELGVRDHFTTRLPFLHLLREITWFEKVEAVVPPSCRMMKNKNGHFPRTLFWKEHDGMMKNSRSWMRNTADSWMLISTLLFSVVFASVFAVPGGYDQSTGIPVLYKSKWFTCLVIFEAVAMLFSTFSIFYFSHTMMLSEQERFERLPIMMTNGYLSLSLSIFGAVSVFVSAYFLVYMKERAALVTSLIIVYASLVPYVFLQTVCFRNSLSWVWFPKWDVDTLFKQHDDAALKE